MLLGTWKMIFLSQTGSSFWVPASVIHLNWKSHFFLLFMSHEGGDHLDWSS